MEEVACHHSPGEHSCRVRMAVGKYGVELPWSLQFILALTFLAVALAALLDPSDFQGQARFRDLAWVQSKREQWLMRHSGDLRDGTIPFFLYLRPFASTGTVSILKRAARMKKATWDISLDLPGKVVWDDLEAVLARALQPIAPLVALGLPGEQLGASRWAASEDDWQDLIVDLLDQAALVFALPSSHGGTKWELDGIFEVDDWRRKTIFIVPSSGNHREHINRIGGDLTQKYTAFRHLAGYGARLQPGEAPGSDLRVDALATLQHYGADNIEEAVTRHPAGSLVLLRRDKKVKLARHIRHYIVPWFLNATLTETSDALVLDEVDLAQSLDEFIRCVQIADDS